MPLFRKRREKRVMLTKDALLRSKIARRKGLRWRKIGEEIEIAIPLPTSDKGLFSGFFKEPKEKKIMLDEIGGYVWELADGERTVNEIIQKVAEKFKLHRKEVEASMIHFIRMLLSRGLIEIRLPVSNLKK